MANKENAIITGTSSHKILEERRIHFGFNFDGQDADAYMSYSVFQDGGRYDKAYITDGNITENTHVVTLLEFQEISEASDYYHLVSDLRWSKHILPVNFPHYAQNPPLVLVDEIKGFYDEWCETEIGFFQNCKKGDEARETLNKFITILGGVVKGLVYLFKEKKYHGNLTDGIAIDDDLNARLYNMRRNGHEAFEDGIREDIEELHGMISVWLSMGDEFVESRLLRRFQETLENKALMKDCNYLWALNDTMFWNVSQKSSFMFTIYSIIYNGRRNWPETLENSFCFDWQSLIPEQEKDPFRIMYLRRIPEFEKEARYTKNIDLVKFCFRAKMSYNKYACQPQIVSLDEIQAKLEELFDVTQVCFSAVVSYLLQDSTSEEDALLKAKLKAAVIDAEAVQYGN